MRKIILSLSVMLLASIIIFGTNSCKEPTPASSTSRSADIILTTWGTGTSSSCFPPSGGFDCDIEIWTWDPNSQNTALWRAFYLSDANFSSPGIGGGSGGDRKITLPIPQSGQFQINVSLTAKTCQDGCCTECSFTTPAWTGKPVFMGNTGMVENRSDYTIQLSKASCFCCN